MAKTKAQLTKELDKLRDQVRTAEARWVRQNGGNDKVGAAATNSQIARLNRQITLMVSEIDAMGDDD